MQSPVLAIVGTPSVCHPRAMCQNDASKDHKIFTDRRINYSSLRINKVHLEMRKGSPWARALNEIGVGKIGVFGK